MHPPSSPGWAEFTIMRECTQENGNCQSIYTLSSVVERKGNIIFQDGGLVLQTDKIPSQQSTTPVPNNRHLLPPSLNFLYYLSKNYKHLGIKY
jgi:hypothetical protein